jgi:hypothetical protein
LKRRGNFQKKYKRPDHPSQAETQQISLPRASRNWNNTLSKKKVELYEENQVMSTCDRTPKNVPADYRVSTIRPYPYLRREHYTIIEATPALDIYHECSDVSSGRRKTRKSVLRMKSIIEPGLIFRGKPQNTL